MKNKKLTDYIQTKQERLVQIYIDLGLFSEFDKTRKKQGHKMKEVVEASFRKYIDENKENKA